MACLLTIMTLRKLTEKSLFMCPGMKVISYANLIHYKKTEQGELQKVQG